VNTCGLEGRSVDALLSLKKLSDRSKEQYLNSLRQFLVYSHQSPDALVRAAKRRPRAFEKQLLEFLDLKEREASAATAWMIRNAVKKFLGVNKVGGVDWARVDDFVPEKRKFGSDRAPTPEEIRAIMNVCDLRTRCLVLFLSSSGARVGALGYLKWRDVVEVEHEGERFARVTIYGGEREQYDTFVTPEAYGHLLQYRRIREGAGEKITPQSPVFVTQFNVEEPRMEKVRGLSVDGATSRLTRVLREANIRAVIHEGRKSKRFEWKQAHGFRKFFKTRMEMSGVRPIITEMLMGHGIGVSVSYMKPTESEMLQEYAKAIDALTIIGGKTMDRGGVLATIRREMLSTRYGEEEIKGMGDLSKLTTEQFVEVLNRKALGLKGSQKVVPAAEVRGLIEQGWEYVSQLPDGYTIVRLPRNGLGGGECPVIPS
jgi:integrase